MGCGKKLGGIQRDRQNELPSPATVPYTDMCALGGGVCEPHLHTGYR